MKGFRSRFLVNEVKIHGNRGRKSTSNSPLLKIGRGCVRFRVCRTLEFCGGFRRGMSEQLGGLSETWRG